MRYSRAANSERIQYAQEDKALRYRGALLFSANKKRGLRRGLRKRWFRSFASSADVQVAGVRG